MSAGKQLGLTEKRILIYQIRFLCFNPIAFFKIAGGVLHVANFS